MNERVGFDTEALADAIQLAQSSGRATVRIEQRAAGLADDRLMGKGGVFEDGNNRYQFFQFTLEGEDPAE